MIIEGWKIYRKVALPTNAPHENINLEPIHRNTIWKLSGRPLLARWITNFDKSDKSEWYFCIKDEPLNMDSLSKGRRYEIRRSLKLNKVEIVNPTSYFDEIYRILFECYQEYPKKYRPKLDKEVLKNELNKWEKNSVIFISRNILTNEVSGFAQVYKNIDYLDLKILKVPNFHKKDNVTAALVYHILSSLMIDGKYRYISDGERNIVHKTNFMEYLIHQFGFRYAYCDLNVKYRFDVKIIVKILYPFIHIIKIFSFNKYIYNLYSILLMEKIVRNQKRSNV